MDVADVERVDNKVVVQEALGIGDSGEVDSEEATELVVGEEHLMWAHDRVNNVRVRPPPRVAG